MRFYVRKIVYLLVVTTLLASCGNFEKVRKSSDVNYKLTKANEYFDKKDYAHANELYKDLMPIMKSTRNFEALYYKYTYSFFYLKDYLEASYFFKNFTEYFPTSKDAQQCEFMSAVCLFKFSPKFPLDQTNSIKALEALQSYVMRYPKSQQAAEANGYIDQIHKKLETKEADGAKLYFNIGQYKAASVTYKSVIRNYPESPNCDLYQFMIMKSMYKYALKSIPEKQEERFANAMSAYAQLKDGYAKSTYMEEAEKISKDIDNKIKTIRNEHK